VHVSRRGAAESQFGIDATVKRCGPNSLENAKYLSLDRDCSRSGRALVWCAYSGKEDRKV